MLSVTRPGKCKSGSRLSKIIPGKTEKPRRMTLGASWSPVLPPALVGLWAGGLYEIKL